MTATKSVVEMLIDQDNHLQKLFSEVRTTRGAERARAFDELRRRLAALEDLDTDAAGFLGTLAELEALVPAHAKNEEAFEFALLLAATAFILCSGRLA